MSPRLLVFSGLPGTGKSTLARQLAGHLRAVYLRMDSVEAALLNAGLPAVSTEGYAVSYALAEDQLRPGMEVVVDCVNPLGVTRGAWADVAGRTGAHLVNLEVVCVDSAEHQRRVETRRAQPEDHSGRWSPPDWPQAQRSAQGYQAWTSPHLTVETGRGTPEENFGALLKLLGG
ncbi:AAA family ATPase [Deinococcus hopiensis]|nr:AAA family ATPase [Deinococcus hopiensis]